LKGGELLLISYSVHESTKSMHAWQHTWYYQNVSVWSLILILWVPCVDGEHYFMPLICQGAFTCLEFFSSTVLPFWWNIKRVEVDIISFDGISFKIILICCLHWILFSQKKKSGRLLASLKLTMCLLVFFMKNKKGLVHWFVRYVNWTYLRSAIV